MLKVCPHLTFDGRCQEAFRLYERTLGGTIATMLTYGDSPMAEQVPPDMHGKIVHATLDLGNAELTGADVRPENYRRPQGFYVLLNTDDPVQTERIFHTLADNGAVEMPVQKTFWSAAYGMLVDQFGIPWEISCEHAHQ